MRNLRNKRPIKRRRGGLSMESVEKLRTSFAQKLSGLSVAARIAVVVLACVVIGGLVFWLCNELIYFYTARSYTEELADAYDLNSGQSRAILWASFAAIVVLAGYTLFCGLHFLFFKAEALVRLCRRSYAADRSFIAARPH